MKNLWGMGMTIYGDAGSQVRWSWVNDVDESGQKVCLEMPMKINDRYSVVPIYTAFPEAEKSFSAIIRRVDMIGKWILVLSKLKPAEEKRNEISLSLKIPYRLGGNMNFCVKHCIIHRKLLTEKEVPFTNVTLINSESNYSPEKINLPEIEVVTRPQPGDDISLSDDEDSYECEKVPKYKTWSSGRCVLV